MSRSGKASLYAILALFSLTASIEQCSAGIYSFDNKQATVNFTYYVGFASQSGRFTDLNGVFQFDRGAPAQGAIKAVIKTASLTADAFESELKGSRFFNVGVFPEIRFASRSVKPVGENRAEFNGDLTMNGVTRPVTLQVVFQPEGRARMVAKTRLKRSEFNMTSLAYLVSDEIDIEITAALREKK